MLQQRHWPNLLLLLMLLTHQLTLAIEDITNRKALFGVPIKVETGEISHNNELFLFHEDGRVELIQEPSSEPVTTESSINQHEFRAKPLPTITVEKGNERKPIDNFGDVYQKINESIFHQAKVEKADYDNPYPPLPTIEFNDDPTPVTEVPISKSSLNRGQVFEHVTDENFLDTDDFNSGYRPTTEEHFRRTTTQEPGSLRTTNYVTTKGTSTSTFVYSQQTPPAEGRFQHFREQELLEENRGFTTTTTAVPQDNGSGNQLDSDETVPPPPAPDWAVNMMISPDSSTDNGPEPGTDEPFLVTDSLKTAFSTPNGGEVAEEATRKSLTATTVATLKTTNGMGSEVPTMKMFAYEMQRGDIDVRGNSQYNVQSTVQNTFTPLSKRRPQPSESTSGSVLMPQELPNDVDLPRTYEIGPRFVLPLDKGEGSGTAPSSNEVDLPQKPPIAPPTLVSAERDRDELKKEVESELHRISQPVPTDVSLHTAPRRGGGAAPLIPISTPKTAPHTLATFGQKDRLPSVGGTASIGHARPVSLANAPFTSFTRPVATSLPAIQVNSEDYSNEVESETDRLFRTLATKPPGDHNTLIALPPSPDYRPRGYTNQPGFEPSNGPPGIVIVSSPPGYFPNNLVATTPSYLPKTSTPYFTEILIPKRPLTKHSNDPNREYSPRVPTTTQRPQQTTQPNPNYQDGANSADYVNQRVSYGSFGRTKPTSSVVYDPNVKLNNNSYFTSARDRSQHNLNAPSIRLPERQGYKVPNARFKVYDPTPSVATQTVQGGKAAFFFIPPPIHLSMSKAIQLRPFHSVFPPVHTPRHLLQNAVPTIPPPLPYLSPTTQRPPFGQRTTPSRLIKFRNDQGLVSNSIGLQMNHHNQLNWVPIGLAAPKRLGAVKLVPAHSMQERIEIQPVEDLDAKRADQTCSVDPRDEFADLRLETRQIARKCFKRAVNCLLHEIVPLERRISYSEEQCLNFCGHHPFCRSLVYSSTMSICDIFDSRNGTGPTRAVSYAGSKYYEPLNSVAMECWKARLNDKFFTKAPQSAVLVDSDDKDDIAHDQKQNDEEQSSSDKTAKSAPVVVALKDHCDVDKDVVVLKSVGFRLRNLGVPALHQNSSETECVFSCLVNLARGHVPYNCASTSYGRLNGCLIYRTGSTNTHGNGHLVPESSFTHYEKACVSNQLVDLCRGYPIIRQPQHTLLGYSKQAIQAQSLIECLELCFNDYVQGGNCKSVSYYYEERKDNCILNTESRQSMPQFFITEDDEVVDYASFESCFNARTDLRHKALKGQSPTQSLKKPPRLSDRRFVPHAIPPPPGASFKKSTTVYTSTLVTRPPPQTYFPRDQMEQKEIINTNNKHVYIVDEDRRPQTKEKDSKRRNPKIPVKKFIVTSDEQPKQFGSKEGDGTDSLGQHSVPRELSRILHNSIHKLGRRR